MLPTIFPPGQWFVFARRSVLPRLLFFPLSVCSVNELFGGILTAWIFKLKVIGKGSVTHHCNWKWMACSLIFHCIEYVIVNKKNSEIWQEYSIAMNEKQDQSLSDLSLPVPRHPKRGSVSWFPIVEKMFCLPYQCHSFSRKKNMEIGVSFEKPSLQPTVGMGSDQRPSFFRFTVTVAESHEPCIPKQRASRY